MKRVIEQRLVELKERVEKFREIIKGINAAIENDDFTASPSQQQIIDYTLSEGTKALKEIKKLQTCLKS